MSPKTTHLIDHNTDLCLLKPTIHPRPPHCADLDTLYTTSSALLPQQLLQPLEVAANVGRNKLLSQLNYMIVFSDEDRLAQRISA